MSTIAVKTDATHPDRLRQTLLADVVVTGAAGLLLTLAAGPLGDLFDLPVTLLRVAGVALIPWTAFVLYVATRPVIPRAGVWTIAIGNLAWTIASLVLIVSGAVDPSTLGIGFVIVQAAIVSVFAARQFASLRQTG